jgi:DnaJ like chaperone protein
MSYWGKILGSVAGFAMGGPLGAVVGAAIGHAAESGGLGQMPFGINGQSAFGPARIAAMLGQRDQVFAMSVVVLSAKLARVDGPVNRAEIDAFKRCFRIPPEAAREIGRLFDHARDSNEKYEPYARQLGETFADNRGMLEEVLTALFAIARADKPVNLIERDALATIAVAFGLDRAAWDRASGAAPRRPYGESDEDPYTVLGVSRETSESELRATWKRLMRENHPDSLASRGVQPEFIARASDKVARINAAWDRIKRERGL